MKRKLGKRLSLKPAPFGQANTRRARSYPRTAEAFLEEFPIGSEFETDSLLVWAARRDELPDRSRSSVYGVVRLLRKCGTSRYTPTPFYIVSTQPHHWRVQASNEVIKVVDLPGFIRQAAEHKRQLLRHLFESIDPSNHSELERLKLEVIWDQDSQYVSAIIALTDAWWETYRKLVERIGQAHLEDEK